jgi:integrase
MGSAQVEAFRSHLATERRVAASTQNQALSSLLFLYREVLAIGLPWMEGIARAKRPARVPVVLSEEEVKALLAQLDGTRWFVARRLYATGMRLIEAQRLRVEDLDFQRREITVRDGKGGRDRRTLLPERLIEPLKTHLERVKALHERDLADGRGGVYLPFALARKYPHEGRGWPWQYVFPAGSRFTHPRGGAVRRHRLDEQVVLCARVEQGRAGREKPARPHQCAGMKTGEAGSPAHRTFSDPSAPEAARARAAPAAGSRRRHRRSPGK